MKNKSKKTPKSDWPLKGSEKPKGKLAALLDDDDELDLAPKIEESPGTKIVRALAEIAKPKGKLASLMDDDDDAIDVPAVETPAKAKAAAKKEPEQTFVRTLVSPAHFFNVQTKGGVRVTVIDRLGKDSKDLLCYNWELRATMHLKSEDLIPRDLVNEVTAFLEEIRK